MLTRLPREAHGLKATHVYQVLTTGGSPKLPPPSSWLALSVAVLHGLDFWGAMAMGRLTYGSVEGGVQIRDKHLWVDIVQVPGKVVAAQLFPQFQSLRNVTEVILQTKEVPSRASATAQAFLSRLRQGLSPVSLPSSPSPRSRAMLGLPRRGQPQGLVCLG